MKNQSKIALIHLMIIFTVVISLIGIAIWIYYFFITNVPSVLQAEVTNLCYESNFSYESEINVFTSFEYNKKNSWALYQIVDSVSYIYCPMQQGCSNCGIVNLPPEFDEQIQIQGKDPDGFDSVYAYVFFSQSKRMSIVAFTGTATAGMWRSDFDIYQLVNEGILAKNGGKVHRGFYNIYSSVRDNLIKAINKFNTRTQFYNWIVSGHSLGGALATLCAFDLYEHFSSPPQLYTAGQPRVGNKEFSIILNDNLPTAYRITNNSDIITDLPPAVLFGNNWEHAFKAVSFSKNLKSYTKNHTTAYKNYLRNIANHIS